MSQAVVPAIPASAIAAITPSVLSAGGSAMDLSGVILTASQRVPTGTLQLFTDAADVSAYFGSLSQEVALGSIYFGGFDNSNKKPAQLFFWQYAWQLPVAAWLRGGSLGSMTLAQLQASSGTLGVVIDGATKSASITLSGATSFSNAAEIIGNSLGIVGVSQGSYTGSILGGTLTISAVVNGPQHASFIGSIAGGTLTVTTLNSGTLLVGDLIAGTGVTAGTTITAQLSGVGGVGTYSVSVNQTAASQNITSYQNSGAIGVGTVLSGTGVVANTYVTALLSGTGGAGTYSISTNQTAGSEAMLAFSPAVVFDSISSAFVIYSGTTGLNSSISFGSGALATSLSLTQALGAVTSQGAAQSTPSGALNAVLAASTNWASFMTTFEPVPNDKAGFASWASANFRHYACVDTSVQNTVAGGPSPGVAAVLAGNYTGTSLIYENPAIDTVGGEIAAFVLGYGASIDFTETQGRATAAFKSQAGLAAQVFSNSIYQFLLSYGMNCYGDFTTANEAFTFYSNGSVTGEFDWLDSYLDAIWLTNALQLSLMVLLTQAKSVPYNQLGYGLIAAAMQDPIAQALNAGVIQPGVPLSALQAAEVNAAAGIKIDNVLSTVGWYLQIKPATAQVRAARQSPPITLWYTDGESVQQVNVASVLIQ